MFEIDHVAHAVSNLEAASEKLTAASGVERVWTFENESWNYRTAYMLIGSDMFTLIEPTNEDSFIADYLDRNGPGLHHLGVNVENITEAVDQLTAVGGDVIMEDTIPDVRTEATFHPGSLFGLQLQLVEWDESVGPTAREHIEAMQEAAEAGRL